MAKFIIFYKQHLEYLIIEFTCYYKMKSSHMERDRLPPINDVPDKAATLTLEQIEVKSYLGGPVKSFERRAA